MNWILTIFQHKSKWLLAASGTDLGWRHHCGEGQLSEYWTWHCHLWSDHTRAGLLHPLPQDGHDRARLSEGHGDLWRWKVWLEAEGFEGGGEGGGGKAAPLEDVGALHQDQEASRPDSFCKLGLEADHLALHQLCHEEGEEALWLQASLLRQPVFQEYKSLPTSYKWFQCPQQLWFFQLQWPADGKEHQGGESVHQDWAKRVYGVTSWDRYYLPAFDYYFFTLINLFNGKSNSFSLP